jgi:hypothetical protein
MENNLDAKGFMNLLLQKYRALLLMKVDGNMKSLYEQSVSTDDLEFLQKLLSQNSDKINSANLGRMIGVANESSHCFLPFLPLELFLVGIIVG